MPPSGIALKTIDGIDGQVSTLTEFDELNKNIGDWKGCRKKNLFLLL